MQPGDTGPAGAVVVAVAGLATAVVGPGDLVDETLKLVAGDAFFGPGIPGGKRNGRVVECGEQEIDCFVAFGVFAEGGVAIGGEQRCRSGEQHEHLGLFVVEPEAHLEPLSRF